MSTEARTALDARAEAAKALPAVPSLRRPHAPLSEDSRLATELLEDICENERSNEHLTGGVKLAPGVLSKYAGTYEFAAGREAVVSVAGDQLLIQDSANPLDSLFVARSETVFLSSVSQVVIEFVKDAQGAVTHFMRTGAGKDGKAVRKGGVQDQKK